MTTNAFSKAIYCYEIYDDSNLLEKLGSSNLSTSKLIHFFDIDDENKKIITYKGKRLKLAPLEYKILKYLMKNSRVNIYIASSFSQVGDGSILKRKQYNFVKLPVSRSEFCSNVAHMIEMRENELYKWPGGKSPRMSLAG